jgi:hypothetical protein
MDISSLFPSKYLKGEDLGGKEVTVTIKCMRVEKLGQGPEKEDKAVLYFERATKALILNRTNALAIASLYGGETDDWRGKRIILYSEKVRAFGKIHDAVRVKEVRPAAPHPEDSRPAKAPEPALAEDPEDMLDQDDEGMVEGSALDQDVDFGKMWEQSTPPRQKLLDTARKLFGEDAEMAMPWVLRRWMRQAYPSQPVGGEADLSDDQRDEFSEYLIEYTDEVLRIWPDQKTAMLKRQAQLKMPPAVSSDATQAAEKETV